jgi:uncharacterized phage protein (TIGR02220 family)
VSRTLTVAEIRDTEERLDVLVSGDLAERLADVCAMARQVARPEVDNERERAVLELFDYIREKTGKRHVYSAKSKGAMYTRARLAEGYKPEDIKAAIDNCYRAWGRDPRMSRFVRLQTICQPTKLPGYIGGERIPTHDDEG